MRTNNNAEVPEIDQYCSSPITADWDLHMRIFVVKIADLAEACSHMQ